MNLIGQISSRHTFLLASLLLAVLLIVALVLLFTAAHAPLLFHFLATGATPNAMFPGH